RAGHRLPAFPPLPLGRVSRAIGAGEVGGARGPLHRHRLADRDPRSGEGITGSAAQSRRPILVPDASQDARMVYPPGVAPIEESVLSVPMVTQNRLFGVLTLARLRARSLSLEDLRLMESIAAQTALALANAEQYAQAEQTIKALAMIETLQPTDDAVPDADIDRRILQGLVDLSQADLATLRTLRDDGRYHVAAAGGRSWPKHAVST